MRIIIPEGIGDRLRVIPAGTYEASLERVTIGMSKRGFPKATVRWIITSQNPESEEETVGAPVIDSFSLQEQALWRLNRLYRDVTGEDLPHGDFSPEEFAELLEQMVGASARLVVDIDVTPDGEDINRVESWTIL